MASMQDATPPQQTPPSSPGAAAVVVALGANQGRERATFSAVIAELRRRFGTVHPSRLYRSVALGPTQPDYLNAAVLFDFEPDLLTLLPQLQAIEAEFGRVRAERWGPRTLDLDLLWAGARCVNTFTLTVPHAQLRFRNFALLPLLDLIPEAVDPVDGVPYVDLVDGLSEPLIQVVDQASWWEVPTLL
jgi:2-amino-4-hydroxy-6-hydroxymethyldihydropteridine diphosphokinase